MDMADLVDILKIIKPDNALPVIFDSPHSGRIYPPDFHYACDFSALEKIEDRYVEDLFSAAPDMGAVLIHARFPRTYIDVNRARDDIDETLLDAPWPREHYGDISPSSRSDGGIGLINRLIKPGIPIYNHPLTADEIMVRILKYYDPYHDALATALEDVCYRYGQFWHVNCHSMPSLSAYPKRNITMYGKRPRPSDIVLGDLDGQTCCREFIHFLRDFWKDRGLRVTINDPFKGVEIIRKHAQPTRGKNSIQIEINRSLYMDEQSGKKLKSYEEFKSIVTDMIGSITNFAQDRLEKTLAAD